MCNEDKDNANVDKLLHLLSFIHFGASGVTEKLFEEGRLSLCESV